MKVFLPPLDTKWRLTEDWVNPSFLNNYDNQETIKGQHWGRDWAAYLKICPYKEGKEWSDGFQKWKDERTDARGPVEFLAGTIINVQRYHCSHSGENMITAILVASPCPLLHPKKLGGKMAGRGRIYFSLDQFNTLPPLEDVTNVVSD